MKELMFDKTGKSKDCEVYNYNYFSNAFKLDSKVCAGRNSRTTVFGLENVQIINVKVVGFRIFIFDMTENDGRNIMGDFESREL